MPLVVGFSGTPTSGTVPVAVTFTPAIAGGTPASYLWDFGDGTTSTASGPSHTYERPGVYTVGLMVVSSTGEISSATVHAYVTANPETPEATFTVNPPAGDYPLSVKCVAVQFTELVGTPFDPENPFPPPPSTPTPDKTAASYVWDFGDGTPPITAGPAVSHTYTSAGTFSISLKAINKAGETVGSPQSVLVTAPVTTPGPYALWGNETGLPRTLDGPVGGWKYEVVSDSLREQWVANAGMASAVIRVKRETAWHFANTFLGNVQAVVVDGIYRLKRGLPERHPFLPGHWAMRLEQADLGGHPDGDTSKGIGRDNSSGWPLPRWARYRAIYDLIPFEIRTNDDVDSDDTNGELLRYCVRTRRSIAKEVPYGAGKLVIDDGTAEGKVVGIQPFKTLVYADISYTLIRWPSYAVPRSLLDAMSGTINNDVYDTVPGRGYRIPRGQMLFVGWSENQYMDQTSNFVSDWTLNFRQTCSLPSWNHTLANNGQAVPLKILGGQSGNDRPYIEADFRKLVRPGV